MSLFGVIICAISVGIFKIAALGVDPFQSLMSGQNAAMLTDPNHPVFSGEYVTMYYMGMGITFGSYHAHSATGDAYCKPAN